MGRQAAADLRGRRAGASASAASTSRRSPAALHRAPVGPRRGAPPARRQLAGAGGAAVLHRDPGRPSRRHPAPPLPHRGRRLVDISDEALDGSILDGAAVGDFLLEELERGRERHMRDIVATIQADQYRLITAEPDAAAGHPGRPRHRQDGGRPAPRVVAPLHASRDRSRAAACSSSGRTAPSWSTSRTSCRRSARSTVEQRAVGELVDGIESTSCATRSRSRS